ncbi:MAG: fused MFS/spermidine synthase [Deltaproteobacteria bacterium]|nr:fused MFS/spermidine synthase [Deltaproteobacteria bacterium]
MARSQSAKQRDTPAPTIGRGIPLIVAFVAGWVVMMLEILGARLLAPYFGYSVYQWGALIGVVLACLTCGYYLGGRVGDGSHARGFLIWALIVSATWIILIPPLARLSLPWSRASGPAWGAVVATTLLLGLPSALLGTVSPIVTRLTFTGAIANAAGSVYAVSTLGSIGGTFFTAFYAIPVLGSRTSHYVAGLLLVAALLGLALAGRQLRYLAAIGLVLLPLVLPNTRLPKGVIYEAESIHNIIRVVDRGSDRSLYLNYAAGAQTVMRKDAVLTGKYYDYFVLGPLMNQAKNALFLGVGGGTALKQVLEVYPDVRVVGVDLDPEVLTVAERYFALARSPRLDLRAEDARWYVESATGEFDLIGIDLFVTGQIPFFTTTVEFFNLLKKRLSARGLVMMHIRSVRSGDELLAPFVRTIGAVFPSVFVFGRNNLILVASKTPVELDVLIHALERGATAFPAIQPVVAQALTDFRRAVGGDHWPIFTDDRNDVEIRTFRMSYQKD